MSPVPGSPEASICPALRRLLQAGGERDREAVAAWLLAYMRGFLLARRARWRHGFSGGFEAEVSSHLGLSITLLLRPDAGRAVAPPGLVRALLRCLPGRAAREGEATASPAPHADPKGAAFLLSRTDDELLEALKRASRKFAIQAAQRAHRDAHPAEARLVRSLRRLLKRSRGPRIIADPRGFILATRASDPARRGLRADELAIVVRRLRQPLRAADVCALLDEFLVPDGDHGGWCYLWDLVRACADSARETFLAECGTAPSAPAWGAADDDERGRRAEAGLAALREELERAVRRTLERIRDRGDPGHHDAWTAAAVEMLLRPFDLGRAEWRSFGLSRLLPELLPPEALGPGSPDHVGRVTYLVRRVRRERDRARGRTS